MIVEKNIVLEMAHRLPNHDGKCRNIHGHSFGVSLSVAGPIKKVHSSDDGMVVDFSKLKNALLIIDEGFDHTLTLADYDPLLSVLIQGSEASIDFAWGTKYLTQFGIINALRDIPPTSENLACVWKNIMQEYLSGLQIVSVSVKETRTSETIWLSSEEEG